MAALSIDLVTQKMLYDLNYYLIVFLFAMFAVFSPRG